MKCRRYENWWCNFLQIDIVIFRFAANKAVEFSPQCSTSLNHTTKHRELQMRKGGVKFRYQNFCAHHVLLIATSRNQQKDLL